MRFVLRIVSFAVLGLLFAGVAAAQNYTATMDGLQEVPPNASPATGNATLFLDAAKMLTIHIDCSGLTSAMTAAHIHCCAPPGVNAAIKYSIVPPRPAVCPLDIVVGPVAPADEVQLNNGQMYANIHTQNFPGGEIRGQVVGPVATQEKPWSLVKQLYR